MAFLRGLLFRGPKPSQRPARAEVPPQPGQEDEQQQMSLASRV